MKIDIIGDNDYIVYCFANEEFLNIDNNIEVKNKLKSVFEYIKDTYSKDVSGYYNIVFYIDKFNNYVIEIISDDDDLLYIKNRLDIDIVVNENVDFLFKADDYFHLDKYKYKHNIYFYENEYYLRLKKQISMKKYMDLLENTDIIYKKSKKIVKEYRKI